MVDLILISFDLRKMRIETLKTAFCPLAKTFGVIGVVDREHGPRVGHRLKPFERFASDALGRAVGGSQLGVGGFELLELLEKPVVFSV